MRLADFKNKKVLVMGLGLHGGGVGSAAFFAKRGSHVVVTDLKPRKILTPSLKKLTRWKDIEYHLGGHRTGDFRAADFVIKNPGVPDSSPFLKIAKRAGASILSDVEVFFLACPAPIIGVTGTKGKSTATSLLGQMLKTKRQKRVWIGGNIRKSALEFLPRVQKGDWVVLELSSFQLDSLARERMSPQIAVITNIFPDHLNRYSSMRAYVQSKANIFRFQRKDGILFLNGRDPALRRLAKQARSRVYFFDPAALPRPFKKAMRWNPPPYHLANVAAAIAVAKHLGVGEPAIRNVLKKFRGLSGRMELVRVVRGIEFINDTTATNPNAATEAVIETKKRIGRRGLHVIAGGYDKKLAVDDFVSALLRSAHSVIFLPGTATKIMKLKILRPRRIRLGRKSPKFKARSKPRVQRIFGATSMHQALTIAYSNAKSGDVVLLSPGAASFGLFQHEFDRGDQFVAAVKRLAESAAGGWRQQSI